MSERRAEIAGGSRRDFLRSSGLAAGGAALIGANLPAATQTPNSDQDAPVRAERSIVRASAQAQNPGGAPAGDPQHPIRASAPAETHLRHLGPLHNLGGTWVGSGFNLISLPDFADGKPFRLKLSATRETLEFIQIGGNVPNRGSQGQQDINLFGLTYLQRVSDAVTNGALHIEPGLWLFVPETDVPKQGATVVRQGSIPHGTSILAQGAVIPTINGGPTIKVVDSTPFTAAGPIADPTYLAPFSGPPLPPDFKPAFVKNLNLALQEDILGQTIVETVVLSVSTLNGGGIVNIPFVVANANVTQFDAIFWIEKVLQTDGSHFMQLQYTQTVILSFLGISWPHISVATLVKQ
jgi:hypothetical protein